MGQNESKPLPKFNSIDELIEFFDTHDMGKYWAEMPEVGAVSMPAITQLDAIHIFTDFLASHPTDEEILDFRFPDDVEARAQTLITKNNAGTITPEELRELEEYERLDTYGGLLKTKIMQRRRASRTR